MLSKALTTDGWMEDATLTWLNKQGKKYKKIVEVGSWKGKSTLALAEFAQYVIAIDNWKGPKDLQLSQEERDGSYQVFLDNLHDYIEDKRVIPLKAQFEDLTVETLPCPPPFDMVFIDGDHTYSEVSRDIKFWLPLVRKNGLLCGHDYSYAPYNTEVVTAVQDSIPISAKAKVKEPVWNVWAVTL